MGTHKWQRMKIKDYKPLVYISTRYTRNAEQERCRANKLMDFVVANGGIPIHPILIAQRAGTHTDIEDIKKIRKILLSKCDEVYIFDDKNTEDTEEDSRIAIKQGKPVKKFTLTHVIDILLPD